MSCATLLWAPPLPYTITNSYNNNKKKNHYYYYCNNNSSKCYYSKFSFGFGCYASVNGKRKQQQGVCCSGGAVKSWPEDEDEQGPPQEAVLKAISEVSKTEGRVGQTTNVVIGGTVTDDSTNEWLSLDKKVNSYPTVRDFTAIGTGGDDFVLAMVVAVESVIHQPIPEDQVKHKLSSGGKYVSVNIGPVHVISSEQVQAVYNAMKRDDRMKYFL